MMLLLDYFWCSAVVTYRYTHPIYLVFCSLPVHTSIPYLHHHFTDHLLLLFTIKLINGKWQCAITKALDDQLSSFVSISILKLYIILSMYIYVFFSLLECTLLDFKFQMCCYSVLFCCFFFFFWDASNVNVHFLACLCTLSIVHLKYVSNPKYGCK